MQDYRLYVLMRNDLAATTSVTFTHTYGNLHIYENHKEQLKREPKVLPKLWLNPKIKNLFDFKYDDVKLIDYDPHPVIKMPIAV